MDSLRDKFAGSLLTAPLMPPSCGGSDCFYLSFVPTLPGFAKLRRGRRMGLKYFARYADFLENFLDLSPRRGWHIVATWRKPVEKVI